jgi:hypothetical protein
MDFPPTWVVLPAEDYKLATPRIEGELTAEVMAQVRRSDRILNHFKIIIGGSKQLEVDIDLHALMPLGDFKGWRMTGQFWPRDLAFRQNTFSTAWIDAIVTNGAEIPQREVLRIVEATAEEEGCPEGASFRWAVVAAEDNFLRMQLQSLPGQAVLLSGKALLKGKAYLISYIRKKRRPKKFYKKPEKL